jgi:lipoyl(octanoyl) transferase
VLPLTLINLGTVPYLEALELQRSLHKKLLAGEEAQYLITCTHPPVITIGKSGSAKDILAPQALLQKKGIQVVEVERGGQATYHGPEQIILYPILNLNHLKRDVGWYVRSLEEAVIRTLDDFAVTSTRIKGKPGVWITGTPPRKIASLGVKMSRWCTFHGISLNILSCAEQFKYIVPCGEPETAVTSITEISSSNANYDTILSKLTNHFCSVFNLAITSLSN